MWFLVTKGSRKWADGSHMPVPPASWHAWDTGQPDNADSAEDCSVMTNYEYWAIFKQTLDRYVWRDYSCDYNPANEIQGYICESKC